MIRKLLFANSLLVAFIGTPSFAAPQDVQVKSWPMALNPIDPSEDDFLNFHRDALTQPSGKPGMVHNVDITINTDGECHIDAASPAGFDIVNISIRALRDEKGKPVGCVLRRLNTASR